MNTTCLNLPTLQHGSIVQKELSEDGRDESYRLGEKLYFKCDLGYRVKDRPFFECKGNDKWSEATCIPQRCGDPGHVPNARRDGLVFNFPHSVNYKCDAGYTMRGISQRFCQNDGNWSGRLPTCERIMCPQLKKPKHGSVEHRDNFWGTVATYKCDRKYRLIGESVRTCGESGWSGVEPTCAKRTCPRPSWSGPYAEEEGYDFGRILSVYCVDGQRGAAKCGKDGNWILPQNCVPKNEPTNVPEIPPSQPEVKENDGEPEEEENHPPAVDSPVKQNDVSSNNGSRSGLSMIQRIKQLWDMVLKFFKSNFLIVYGILFLIPFLFYLKFA